MAHAVDSEQGHGQDASPSHLVSSLSRLPFAKCCWIAKLQRFWSDPCLGYNVILACQVMIDITTHSLAPEGLLNGSSRLTGNFTTPEDEPSAYFFLRLEARRRAKGTIISKIIRTRATMRRKPATTASTTTTVGLLLVRDWWVGHS